MSLSPIASTVGLTSSRGHKIVRLVPTETNNATHVSRNPDQGRIIVRRIDGTEFSTVPAIIVGSVTMIQEGV